MSTDVDKLDYWIQGFFTNVKGNPNDAFFDYVAPPRDIAAITQILNEIETTRSAKARSAQEKGAKAARIGSLFEKLMRKMFDDCLAFKFDRNLRTTTSEVDLIFSVEPLGMNVPMLQECGAHFVGEARCRSNEPPSSEWVNEVSGFMDNHKVQLAFLFVGCTSRSLDSNVRQAISLCVVNRRVIVPFGMKQFSEIIAGKNVLRVMHEQFMHSKFAVSKLAV